MPVHERVPEGNVIICGARSVASKSNDPTLRVTRSLHVESEAFFVTGVKGPNITHLLTLWLLSFDEQSIDGANAVPENVGKH